MKLITNPSDVTAALADAEERGPCRRVLMAAPDYFNIESAINPWMRNAEGELNVVDSAKARYQWDTMARAYRDVGIEVQVIEGPPGLPDFCFAANQSLTCRDASGRQIALLSEMASETRREEVAHFRHWYKAHGFTVVDCPPELRPFEGTGDASRHHGRHAFWGGVGPRTGLDAWNFVAETTGASVIPLNLPDPRYYHLDTCLAVLSPRAALYVPAAFDDAGRSLLAAGFDDLIAVSNHDAANFACNAHCPDGTHVLIQQGSGQTLEALVKRGFTVIELDTSEFMKSGGSVFCLKQELP
ncbi:MAG: amidinotransferase [Planctomycetes bacterium]|nr:amidinotransferase [Planctomycetota bacterium]